MELIRHMKLFYLLILSYDYMYIMSPKFLDLYKLKLSKLKWSILVCVLTSEEYTAPLQSSWKDKTRSLGEAFPVLKHNSTVDGIDVVKELTETDKVLTYQVDNGAVSFVSDDVRHQVMSYFVLNCLTTVQDYENYIRLSSVDSLLEYVRTWWYKRDKGERCLYLPEGLEETFVRRLGIDAVRHVMVEGRVDSDGQPSRGRHDPVINKVRTARKFLSSISPAKRYIVSLSAFLYGVFSV
jgi:hypothetical protein